MSIGFKKKKEMKNGGVPDDMIDLVNTILRYVGTKSHGPGLYGVGNKDIMSKMTKTFFTSVQGVSNVYAQHVPVLIETLEAIMKGKLRTESHPYLTNFFYIGYRGNAIEFNGFHWIQCFVK